MEVNKIAALYCRLSKHEDTKIESNSIANQKATLLKAAQSYEYERTQFFIDDGYSGAVFDSPALSQLQNSISRTCFCRHCKRCFTAGKGLPLGRPF